MKTQDRFSGILLHVTSLPSRFGVGDLGPEAKRFVDFLAESGQRYWQMLPLNPTSPIHGNSPYSSDSAFAGNPLLISPEVMLEAGLLQEEDFYGLPRMPVERVKYRQAAEIREELLRKAFARLESRPLIRSRFEEFRKKQADWLEDYALFRALKNHFDQLPWTAWPQALQRRESSALATYRDELRADIDLACFRQFVFFSQWQSLREYCRRKGVQLIGDIPIYVNEDSVDVWANPRLFKLDASLRPRVQAGVPPDYFSETGQLWGNPVYDWEQMQKDDFSWWVWRIRHNITLFDMVRLDHFRGFVACWEVPAGHKTAMHGKWVDLPARAFFRVLSEAFDPLPLIAEDLGTIDDAVRDIMREFSLPGMKILLFAFGPDLPSNPYVPHNHIQKCFVYTGTHDNNTVRGWFEEEADAETLARVNEYLDAQCTAENIAPRFVRLAMQSVAETAIFPLQDILGLSAASKMNVPGVSNGNWSWRVAPDSLNAGVRKHLLHLTTLYGRGPTHQ
ncbi:4-alpha-glucanotransferase [Desulfonatronum parangueonense]